MQGMSSMEESDEALIGRYVRGDAPAFDQLYKRNEQRVWRYLERNVRNQATADELLQEIWFALSRNAVSLESATRFRTRLFTLTHDKMTNTLREQPLPEAPPLESRPTRDPAGLAQVLAHLPREQREPFLLQAEGQLSVGEIAEITESTIDSTQGSLRLAKLQLREQLGEGDVPANPEDLSDVDQLYRRLSGVDPGKPGEWVRRKVQAYSAQQAAERSVRESAKAREAAPAAVAAAAPAPAPRVTPASAARVTAEPKQSASKPWLLPVIGAVVVVALVGIFVVPSLRAPSVPIPPPPPVAPPETTASASQAPSTADSAPPAPAAQPSEPEAASTPPPAASPPPPPAQVAQSSPPPPPAEEPHSAPQPAPAPASATNTAHAQTQTPAQPKAPARVAHPNTPTPPPSPPVAMTHTPSAPQAPVNNPAPAAPSVPVSAPQTAATPPPPVAQPVAVAATPAPAPTPAAPPAASGPVAPPDDFYHAAEAGDMGRLNEVLASNVDVNSLDSKGRTALILAINRGHIDVVKALLAHGADATKVDSHGMSPKAAAHARGSFEIQAAIDRAARH